MTGMENEESEKPRPPANSTNEDDVLSVVDDVLSVEPDKGPAGTLVTITFKEDRFNKINKKPLKENQFKDGKFNEDLDEPEEVWFGNAEAKEEAKEIEGSPKGLKVRSPKKAEGDPDKVKIWIKLDYEFIYVGDFTYDSKEGQAKKKAEAQKEEAQAKAESAEARKAEAEKKLELVEARIAEALKVLSLIEAQKVAAEGTKPNEIM
jgi:hypothetical protein